MAPYHQLDTYWRKEGGISFSGVNVLKVVNRRTEEVRVAWHLAGETRWHLTPVLGEEFAKTVMTFARDDSRRGDAKLTTFRHRMKIYAREAMPAIWKAHRKRMEARREAAAIKNLPNFGLF